MRQKTSRGRIGCRWATFARFRLFVATSRHISSPRTKLHVIFCAGRRVEFACRDGWSSVAFSGLLFKEKLFIILGMNQQNAQHQSRAQWII